MGELTLGMGLVLVLSLLVTGMVAGIISGLLGVGGGIVIVPVLYFILSFLHFPADIAMHMAVGTSLLTIIPTSISSMRSHDKRGGVDWDVFKRWLPAIATASLVGGIVARFVDGSVLLGLFALIAGFASYNMLKPLHEVWYDSLPRQSIQMLIAGFIGFVSSWMGIGGGTLTVPTLTLCNYPVHRAIGTSSALGLIIAVPGALGFMIAGWEVAGRPPLSIGYVNVLAGAIIFSMSTLFAPIGTKLAHVLNPVKLRRVFAIFLAITAVRMLLKFFGW